MRGSSALPSWAAIDERAAERMGRGAGRHLFPRSLVFIPFSELFFLRLFFWRINRKKSGYKQSFARSWIYFKQLQNLRGFNHWKINVEVNATTKKKEDILYFSRAFEFSIIISNCMMRGLHDPIKLFAIKGAYRMEIPEIMTSSFYPSVDSLFGNKMRRIFFFAEHFDPHRVWSLANYRDYICVHTHSLTLIHGHVRQSGWCGQKPRPSKPITTTSHPSYLARAPLVVRSRKICAQNA